MSVNFVHLHVHSQYSLLEGAIRVKDLCQEVARLKMPAVALTDSANLFGAYEFYEKARAAGIKPIFGAEVYYLTKGDLTSRDVKDKKEFLANLILLAKDEEGYHNLCELLSLAHLKGFYYKPRLDRESLSKHSQGLIALSGTMEGEIHQRLLREEKDQAVQAADFLLSTYGDNFYLELQDHQLPLEARVKDAVSELTKELQLPVVATNDCHYLKKDQAEAQLVLECIKKGWTLNEALDRGGTRTEEAYLKTPQEMGKIFKDRPEALANTIKIMEACQFSFESKSYHLPQYKVESGKSLD
ncbi:MAG: PHP domain-containing protein, partial [Deltaproteobacteria bacterium]|nr:PHP domain-containing protein [Deltaproteobacteria bacterium]